MLSPKLETERGRRRRKRLINESKERITLRSETVNMLPVMRGGDNFRFVRWGELADLKLWAKRED